jgi:hypothetical protein
MGLNETNVKHLEMLQTIVTRMNTNSFQIKGFTVAIISAIVALYERSPNEWFIWIGFPPILILWILDSYYLQHERIFREIYNDIVANGSNTIKEFEMPFKNYKGWKFSVVNAMILSVNGFVYIALIVFFLTFIIVI